MTDPTTRAEMDAARGRVAAYGPPNADEMDALRDIVSGDLQPSDLFVVEMIPSSTDTDSYFTRMDPGTTLSTFAQDSADGVPIMYNHARSELPIGRTFGGQLVSAPFTSPRGLAIPGTADAPVVWSRYYMVRGMATPSGSTDDVMRGIQAGINQDVSVGFGNSPRSLRANAGGYWYRCDECGNDLLRSSDCTHWPGMVYTDTESGARRRLTATVMNAGLLETSPVWRGSNPGAHMLRAMEDRVTRGVLSYADIADIDGATGQRFAATLDWAALKPKGRIYMTAEEIAAKKDADAKAEEARRALLDAAHADETTDAAGTDTRADDAQDDTTRAKGDESPLLALLRTHEITDEGGLRRVLAEAEDGRLYRADLIELCHRAGVRAEGASYSRAVNARMLDVLGTADLQTVLASRNAAARERFAKDDGSDPATEKLRGALADRVGGRQTQVSGPLGITPERAAPVEIKSRTGSYKVGKGK